MEKMKGLSAKEIKVVSYLELEKKRFFTRNDIKKFFKNKNELNVYIHKLKKKKRIIKINKNKYYLIPIQAYKGKWSEHPFILIDEICNSKGYCIGGKSAAHYWGFIEQIPIEIEVFSRTRQGKKKLFGFNIIFRRVRRLPKYIKRKIKDHDFLIAAKDECKRWI
jgi:predicted transcriptional regulator of viral defense system